ncbi:hypothetical protein FRC11_013690 [Ceratobasidium sp. 423]|nr:hypothetical protein FRC11_013690 [Ceratobasidium sp. 423]
MTDEETIAWGAHIRAGDNHEIEEGWRFQFDMPLMGHPWDWYQLVREDRAQLNYGPDVYAYVRQLSNYKEMPIPSQEDRLPMFHPDTTPYQSFTESEYAAFQTGLSRSPESLELLAALQEFDLSFLFEVTESIWHLRIPTMPHLKLEAPSPRACIDHLVEEGGLLPHSFYDISHPEHFSYGLARLIEWCSPRLLTHTVTRMVFGGPMGVKWPTLLLIHLQLNVFLLADQRSTVEEYYGELVQTGQIIFLLRDLQQIQGAIRTLTTALTESTEILRESLGDRCVLSAVQHVAGKAQQAHAHYPTSGDAYTPYNAQVDYNDWKNNFTDWFTDNAEKAEQSAMEIDNQEEEEHAVSTQHAVQTRSRVGKGKGKAREMKQARPMQPKRTHSSDQPERRLKRKGGRHMSFSTDTPGINRAWRFIHRE